MIKVLGSSNSRYACGQINVTLFLNFILCCLVGCPAIPCPLPAGQSFLPSARLKNVFHFSKYTISKQKWLLSIHVHIY